MEQQKPFFSIEAPPSSSYIESDWKVWSHGGKMNGDESNPLVLVGELSPGRINVNECILKWHPRSNEEEDKKKSEIWLNLDFAHNHLIKSLRFITNARFVELYVKNTHPDYVTTLKGSRVSGLYNSQPSDNLFEITSASPLNASGIYMKFVSIKPVTIDPKEVPSDAYLMIKLIETTFTNPASPKEHESHARPNFAIQKQTSSESSNEEIKSKSPQRARISPTSSNHSNPDPEMIHLNTLQDIGSCQSSSPKPSQQNGMPNLSSFPNALAPTQANGMNSPFIDSIKKQFIDEIERALDRKLEPILHRLDAIEMSIKELSKTPP